MTNPPFRRNDWRWARWMIFFLNLLWSWSSQLKISLKILNNNNKSRDPIRFLQKGQFNTSSHRLADCGVFLYNQGSYPFSETNFQDSDWFFKGSKMHINPYTPKISMLILLTAFHILFLAEFNRGLFPGLSSPGKCHNKIPGFCRFFRTRPSPVSTK